MGFFFGGFGSHAKRHFAQDRLSGAYFQDYVTFASLDGFTVTEEGTGSVTPRGNGVRLLTGTVEDNDTILSSDGDYHTRGGSEVGCEGFVNGGTYADTTAHLVCVSAQISTIPVPATHYYFGFKFEDTTVYAVNAAADDGDETDIGITWNGAGTLRVTLDANKTKFYYNGDLKATHATAHLPSLALDFHPHLMVRTTTTAAKSLTVYGWAYNLKE